MFATHPLREVEDHAAIGTDSYLTVYAFSSDLSQPINPQGALAKEVYQMISLLEEDALNSVSQSLTVDLIEAIKAASKELAGWLGHRRKLGGLTKKSYFLPIPVALVAVLS